MITRNVSGAAGTVLSISLLAGCGGGGGGTMPAASISKATIRTRIAVSSRLTRNSRAVTGLTARIGRAVAQRGRAVSRDASTGQDSRTRLYYLLTENPDGSGRYDLFTDAAHQAPAGSIVWNIPAWPNNKPDTYPAVVHAVYEITAGTYKGNKGAADITIQDAVGARELIHATFQDGQGDNETIDANIDNGQENQSMQSVLADGSSAGGSGNQSNDGDFHNGIHFQDGTQSMVVEHSDGSENVTVSGQHGEAEATENNQADGQGQIDFADGSSDSNFDNSQNGQHND